MSDLDAGAEVAESDDQATGRPNLMERRPTGGTDDTGLILEQFLEWVDDLGFELFPAQEEALLEIAAVIVGFDDAGQLDRRETHRFHVRPFEGANIEPASQSR